MPAGVPTPEDKELEFRQHYLVTGNASASARAVGLSIHTGTELARRANADPVFTREREELRARVVPEAERMLMSAMQIALERLNSDAPTPEQLAAIATNYGLKSIGYQDPRAQYFRGMSAAYAAFIAAQKLAEPSTGDGAIEVHVHLKTDDNAGSSSSG